MAYTAALAIVQRDQASQPDDGPPARATARQCELALRRHMYQVPLEAMTHGEDITAWLTSSTSHASAWEQAVMDARRLAAWTILYLYERNGDQLQRRQLWRCANLIASLATPGWPVSYAGDTHAQFIIQRVLAATPGAARCPLTDWVLLPDDVVGAQAPTGWTPTLWAQHVIDLVEEGYTKPPRRLVPLRAITYPPGLAPVSA